MKPLLKPGIFFLLFVLTGINSRAQVLEGLLQNFQQYNSHTLQEKIYVHTDKASYLTGEILWFKLYTVNTALKPSAISKVAYVDVLDNANNPVLQAKISLDNGTGSGSFYIPVTLKNGNYKLRAYTNMMKNFSPNIYFEKTITIINPLTEVSEPIKQTKNNYDISFFAEGGNLINGITTNVAFKAVGTDGKGMDVNGVIINQFNDTVVRFQSLKFGMGRFSIKPVANNTYKAIVRIGRDNSLIKDLPPITNTGYAMQLLTDNNGQLSLKVNTRIDGNNQPVYLFVYSAGKVVTAFNITPGADGNMTVPIDKTQLAKGMNHFTLFNGSRQPVCDRLYFNRPDDILGLRAESQFQYQTRKPVNINISASDHNGKALAANMSLSVYRLDSLSNANEADIVSYLWLGSEIKGNIESPGYYFNTVTAETDIALDNLLLTQGWSRFKLDDAIISGAKPKFTFLPEFDGHIITGQLTNTTGGPVKGINAYLGIIGKRVQLFGAEADSTGHLLFNTKNIYGPGEIVLQTNTEKDSTYRITISSPFSEQYATSTLPPFQLNNSLQRQLEMNSINMQVQNIYSSGKLKQFYNPIADSSAFYGDLYKPYLLDDFTRFTTLEEVFREYIGNVNVAKVQRRYHLRVFDPNGLYVEKLDPLVLLDGIPVFNMDKVLTIDPLKVRRLDVVNYKYYWQPLLADGIINLTTYKGDLGGFELDPRAVVLDYEGMQLQREFYSPVYETAQQQKSRLPDFRNVLYWSPDVNTNATGKTAVSFYTSDKTGKYIGVLQGITANGQAGSYSFKFDVNK